MPPVPLPENPSLEHLKKQAKLLQRKVRSGSERAAALVRDLHPRHRDIGGSSREATRFTRADAQLVTARRYGFASWRAIREYLATVTSLSRPDTGDRDPGEEPDLFVTLACVTYGHDRPGERIGRANAMLGARPALASSSVATMSVVGDHHGLVGHLDEDPTTPSQECGPNRWPPLLYCAYSRVTSDDPKHSTLEAARLLLDRGADPNAGFLWRGLVPPFTALTGAFGRGEQDQPSHPEALALARLLLDAGADPNDGQALYNNGLAGTAHDDPSHLELLVEFGLGTDQGGPWYERFGARLTAPAELLHDELEVAAWRGLPNRMRFLCGLDLDLERPVGRSGETPARLAARQGHTDVLDVLAEAGVASRWTPE